MWGGIVPSIRQCKRCACPDRTSADFYARTQRRVRQYSIVSNACFGEVQLERLGLDYKLADVAPPTAECPERACEVFRRKG